TRGEVARKVVARTTGVLKGVTRRLGAAPQKAPGKLVVIQGANMGKEFRLSAQVVKVGRDPQFCDFALYDEFASNPHFSVQLDQTQFFITDESSTNGTRLNGTPMSPRQRMLLQPDAIIQVGQTQLQFKRLGGATRQLGATPPPPPSRGQAQQTHPATQLAQPSAQPSPGQPGGPTKQVPPPIRG
ncbi:MAG: FHA domain-containing protein, partial [Chloroflexota bacterium]|nr:FHA domain-containing protein [Chloroflexota bacterium]